MKILFIILAFASISLAAGPVFKHKDPAVQDEFKFVYQQLSHKVGSSNRTPGSSTEGCSVGSVNWDTSYIYICTSTGTWKRAALSAF